MNILPLKCVRTVFAVGSALLYFVSQFSGYAYAENPSGSSKLIWSVMSQAVIAVDPESADSVSAILFENDPDALAVDKSREIAWICQGNTLFAYSFSGELILSRKLPFLRGEPNGLWVNENDGSLWLLSRQKVLNFDASGKYRFEIKLTGAQSMATFDPEQEMYWVSDGEKLFAFDNDGQQRQQIDLDGARQLRAMAFNSQAQSIDYIAGETLYSVRLSGGLQAKLVDHRLRQVDHLVADSSGTIWMADDQNVISLNESGVVEVFRPLQQFSPELIVDIEAGDGDGLWVANWRELVLMDARGRIIKTIRPELEGNRQRDFLKLADRNEFFISEITIVSPGQGALLNTESPEFLIDVGDAEVDLSSLVFVIDGKPAEVNCIEKAGLQCHLVSPLADGQFDLVVTADDINGKKLKPGELEFVIDTLAPEIVLNEPDSGLVTNVASISIAGSVGEDSTLKISEVDVPLDEDLRFRLDLYTLVEGDNQISVNAVDGAGNQSSANIVVYLDTVPPALPKTNLIDILLTEEGIAQITGSVGSVESNTTVVIENSRTGEIIHVQADGEGKFLAEILAEDGDMLDISVLDVAGNVGEIARVDVEATPGLEPIHLSIVSPQENSLVSGSTTLVTLLLEAPENTGVLVNDTVATLMPNADGSWTAYAMVPVSQDLSSITATATSMDGRKASATIEVQQGVSPYYAIIPSRFSSIAPFNVSFEIEDLSRLGIVAVTLDADGDGSVDRSYSGDQEVIEFTYDFPPGLQSSSFHITDRQGAVHEVVVPILVLDESFLDSQVRFVWNGMIDALNAGELEKALEFMISGSRESYQPVFEELMPYMPEITEGFSDIYQLDLYSDLASYVLMTVREGQARVFVVQLMVDNDGIWRIDAF